MTDTRQYVGWMDAALRQPAGLRQAALLVHGMAASDREWLLSQLDTAQRASLQPLIDELEQLAIPPDAEIVSEAVRLNERRHLALPAAQDLIQRVGRLPADAVVAVLRAEAPLLARRIMSMRCWPWRAAVASALADPAAPEGHRVEPDAADADVASAPTRLERLLLEALVARVTVLEPRPAAITRPAAGIRRWLEWLRPSRPQPAGTVEA